jgi:hypothetical protein
MEHLLAIKYLEKQFLQLVAVSDEAAYGFGSKSSPFQVSKDKEIRAGLMQLKELSQKGIRSSPSDHGAT